MNPDIPFNFKLGQTPWRSDTVDIDTFGTPTVVDLSFGTV